MLIRAESGEIINFDRVESIDVEDNKIVAYFVRGSATLYTCKSKEEAERHLSFLFNDIKPLFDTVDIMTEEGWEKE